MLSFRRPARVIATMAVAAAMLSVAACSSDDARTQRQADVADRGAEVMPFDLDATTHVFRKTDDGGIQIVRADDPDDERQIALIRQHLRDERANFSRGDFDDPARIHGHDMPGVAELAAGYADITVTFREQLDGARLIYTTDDPELVAAIHSWFDRQVMDHGADASSK